MRLVGIKCRTPARQSQSDLVEPFGVAISGTTALTGALLEGVGGTAYLFDVATGTVLATLTNPSTDPDSGDNFGGGLAIAGGTVVIGAPGDDGVNADGNTGRAYVFRAPSFCSNPAAPAGTLMFNADHRVLQWYDGDAWRQIGGAAADPAACDP